MTNQGDSRNGEVHTKATLFETTPLVENCFKQIFLLYCNIGG